PTHRRFPFHPLDVSCSPPLTLLARSTYQLPLHSSTACEPYLSFSGLSRESSPRPDITSFLTTPTPVMLLAHSSYLVDRR
ncbi:unnamed protein product, partial [Larinioides sclopetarius]